jgi:competence protein CoiA
MRFALIDDKRAEAKPGLKGLCPGCGQAVIAKCGTQRSHHWAHLSDKKCDNWWEPETEWHRSWKNNFPDEWQELVLKDAQTGEKHIADVCTDYGLVIEFQHSHIHPQERTSRENFYKNMIWVVDGTRLKNDYKRFLLNVNSHSQFVQQGRFLVGSPGECCPSDWINCSAPVVFDFQDYEPTNSDKNIEIPLYCLLPNRIGGRAVLTVWARQVFLNTIINGDWSLWADRLMKDIVQVKQEKEDQIARQQQLQENIAFTKFTRRAVPYRTYSRRRRF